MNRNMYDFWITEILRFDKNITFHFMLQMKNKICMANNWYVTK